ncbi:MAG: phospho-sugar mutase, partial [Tissierellia bacterium]|nr:phospho-sugar mutase [Tissierellia bacterium]
MEYQELYESWLNDDFFDKETREELLSIKGDYDEVRDRFYKNLEFGTAGLRGKIGAGTNRMNKYTVALASQGLASTIKSAGQEAMKKGVIISYDVRYFSKEFAEIAAGVLAANKIKVYLSDDIRPTPVLAYGIRYYNTQSGIMVTASHNPKEYNGYKVYWNEGSQIVDDVAEEIITNIEEIGSFKNIDIMPIGDALVQGYVEYIGNDLDE